MRIAHPRHKYSLTVLRLKGTSWIQKGTLILSVLVLMSQVVSGTALAMDKAQKQLFDVGITNFNIADDQVCGSGSAGGGASSGGTVTTDLASFIDTYGQSAFNIGKSSGIPYDAILAHAAVESNNGQSQLNIKANNFFGIKAEPGWTGPTLTLPTREMRPDGSAYYINSAFEVYASPQAGFQAYVDFLHRNQRYANVFNYQHNPLGYFQALIGDGYATQTNYVSGILAPKLSAVDKYIASKGVLQPESQVVYDVQPAAAPPSGGAPASGSSCSVSTNGGSVVAVALGELGNHYAKYTAGRQENWCADFVSWVYKSAGRPFSDTPGVPMLDGWQIPAVGGPGSNGGMMEYLQKRGQFFIKSASAPPPQPGDIVIYKNGMSHTNIVVEANGYMVKTVGGNQESNDITQSVVSESKGFIDIRNDSTVTGWGRLP